VFKFFSEDLDKVTKESIEKIKLDDVEDITGALEITGPFVGLGGAF